MWADLHIKHLCAMKTEDDVKEELGKLPDGLVSTYQQIYERIQNNVREAPRAVGALMWIMSAQRPLSPEEWADGVSWALLKPDGNPSKLKMPVLLDVCQNLVVYDRQLNVMRFSHLSVREFLEIKSLHLQPAEMAAKACLAVLQHPKTLAAQPATRVTKLGPFHLYSFYY